MIDVDFRADPRIDVYDVLIGINLLREGLDIPEVSLIAILDADKEGFLRSETALIQTIGRAARNAKGHVILYADKVTDSMRAALDETAVVTWVSSDTSVVVVNDKGTITAVGYGKANVTATCGEFTGVCSVWVKTYYENLAFTNAVLYDLDTLAFGGEVHEVITSDSSDTWNCYLAMAELWLCADGFYVNNDGYFEGGTYASYITVKAPMYYGTPYLNPDKDRGVQFILGEWKLENLEIDYDESGSIGKRYRREDEIGTPFCITYDFESETDGCVTVRDRDSMEQVRMPISELVSYIEEKIVF